MALCLVLVELLDVLGNTILISWFIASSNAVSQLPTVVAWILDWPTAQLLDLAELVGLGNHPLVSYDEGVVELQRLDQDELGLLVAGMVSPSLLASRNQVCLLHTLQFHSK